MRAARPGVGQRPCPPPPARPGPRPARPAPGSRRPRSRGPLGWARACRDAGLLDLPLPAGGPTADRCAAPRRHRRGRPRPGPARRRRTSTRWRSSPTWSGRRYAEGRCRALGGLGGQPAGRPGRRPAGPAAGGGSTGTKPWCSGPGALRPGPGHGPHGRRLPAVRASTCRSRVADPVDGTWPRPRCRAATAGRCASTAVPADPVGGPQDYLERPGFWHGAVGVAAVWWGGARGVARALSRADARRPTATRTPWPTPARSTPRSPARTQPLAAAAAWIDADPSDGSGRDPAHRSPGPGGGRTRSHRGGGPHRAGARVPAPLATDVEHGRRVADLALYLRQSHAERDLEELGRGSLDDRGSRGWTGRDPDRADGRHRRARVGDVAGPRRRRPGRCSTCAGWPGAGSWRWPPIPTTRCSASAACSPGWPGSAPT